MGRIESLIPEAGCADVAGLREVDPVELADYVVDATHRWWRRKPCAAALAGRVPAARAAALLACIRDDTDVAEVRIALLDIVGDREELLPWLRHEERSGESAYGMAEAILKARGASGDLTAVHALATLANDPWSHRRAIGWAGMDMLVQRFGVEAILAELGEARPEDRAFRVRMRHRAGDDVTDALADPDVGVAHLAYELVSDTDGVRGFLGRAPTVEARIWAACALHRLTGDAAETRAIYDSLGRPRVEIDGLDEEIRGAIVHRYASRQPRTDPRWRIEQICTAAPPPVDIDEQLGRVTTALTAAGFGPKLPLSCSEVFNQGGGTYYVVEHNAGEVCVSTLGRFVSDEAADPGVRDALEAAGFRWIDMALGRIIVTDLCVYYFGRREPLTVHQLLFFWQD